MESQKWFVLSRAIWAALIPIVVAACVAYGIDTTDLAATLEKLGQAAILLVGAILTLRSRFKPDGKTLTLMPNAPPPSTPPGA